MKQRPKSRSRPRFWKRDPRWDPLNPRNQEWIPISAGEYAWRHFLQVTRIYRLPLWARRLLLLVGIVVGLHLLVILMGYVLALGAGG